MIVPRITWDHEGRPRITVKYTGINVTVIPKLDTKAYGINSNSDTRVGECHDNELVMLAYRNFKSRAMPTLIMKDIVGVSPMCAPQPSVAELRRRYVEKE